MGSKMAKARPFMRSADAKKYVQRMITEFRLPGRDALSECILGTPHKPHPIWDSAIVISTEQTTAFYSDMFQFWVRALYSFTEDVRAGSLFQNVSRIINCQPITPQEFRINYFDLLNNRVQDEAFKERQRYPKTYLELEKRSFENPIAVLNQSDIRSAVAESDGEYIAYFEIVRVMSDSSIVVFPSKG
jgi:hypothetical protein